MNIALTGGSGFLGKHLIEVLLREGHNVTVLVRDEIKDSRINSIKLDLLQEPSEEIKSKLKDVDAVIHLAATMPSKLSEGEDIVVQNKIAAKNALSLVDSTKLFILASSVDVYPYLDVVVDENTSLNPISAYGRSKMEAEEVCLQWSKRHPETALTILRFSHLYGPADTNHKMIDTLMRNALFGKKSVIYGDGNDKRTYLFMEDAAKAILLCLKNKKSGIFNVGGNNFYSIKEVITYIEEVLGTKMAIETISDYEIPSNKKTGSSMISSRKFAEATRFVAKTDLHGGLQQLLPKNILFDLDGPILDVKERYYSVYEQFVMENGGIPLSLEEYWQQKRMNTPLEKLLEKSMCPGLISELVVKHKKYLSEHREEYSSLKLDKLQPGVKEILTKLSSRYDLYLITLRRNKENLYRQLDEFWLLPFFKKVLSAVPTSESKWQHKVDLLTEHNLQHESGIIIGDTPTEILAGKKSGLTTIGISNGIRDKEILLQAEPHLLVESVGELKHLPFFKLKSL